MQVHEGSSPFSCTNRVAYAALFFWIFWLFIWRRTWTREGLSVKKQSCGLFLARSGEPGTVACDGRRTVRMQGTAAADGKSLLLHQIESLWRLFFLERFRALRKQSCGNFSAKSDEPFCDGSVCNAQSRQTSSIFSRTDQSRFGGSFFKNNDKLLWFYFIKNIIEIKDSVSKLKKQICPYWL